MFARLVCIACLVTTWTLTRAAQPTLLPGITLSNRSLSVELLDVPLAVVMTDIAARSGIALHLENAAALPHVTAHFTNLPFAEGLAQLLKSAPGSMVVRSGHRSFGGVSAIYVIASQEHTAPLAEPAPAGLEDLRRSIATLQAREVSPTLRQAYEDARAPALDEAAQARSLRRSQNLDSLLREIGNATALPKTTTDATSTVGPP